ncbi:Fic family protein [Marinicella sp. W31]|uniref:Fic family protein n=1 Tax=Marinicella sp. W31 TaxID=3023713 RepID=UPI003758482D
MLVLHDSSPQDDTPYTPWVVYLLTRYLAGDKNLKPPHNHIGLETFVRSMVSGRSKTRPLQVLCAQTKRFIEAKRNSSKRISINDLIYLNSYLVKQKSKQGMRTAHVWVGNPKLIEHAFYTTSLNGLRFDVDEFLTFLNDPYTDVLGRLIVGSHYFYHLHPFKDGNGRVWRCVFWRLLSTQYGDLQSLLVIVYFKLINSYDFYMAQKAMRKGDWQPFIDYWKAASKWSADSFLFMLNIFEGGSTKKGSLNDQINGLLELDYYLKAEKRSYQ